jgi:ATP-dependent DNA helicase RecG
VPTEDQTKQLERLLGRLCALPQETPWAEFKHNDAEPATVGEYLSALSNAASLDGRGHAYMVWGVEDDTHDVVGTTFRPYTAKRGGEDLIPWLTRGLSPQIHFSFDDVVVDGNWAVVLRIEAAHDRPTQFEGTEWIRIGSYKKKLKDYPDHERRLWKSFDSRAFESLTAVDHLTENEVLDLLDHESYFRLIAHPRPEQPAEVIQQLTRGELIRWDIEDEWSITNLGALLIAKDLSKFPKLARKAARVIQYQGQLRLQALHEQLGERGYANGFEGVYEYVMNLVPRTEHYETGLRENRPKYPGLAIRELLANMLVHQDLSLPGSGPMVELFDDRLEITNPGLPLIDKARFVDSPPISRNEKLARALRQMGICEERGSGWDKIAFEVEVNQLPAPFVETTDAHTRVTVYGHKSFQTLTRDEKIRAVYLHSVLRYLQGEQTTNTSVRDRFGLESRQASAVSRLLAEAVEQGWLAPHDRDAGKRAMAYVPFWVGLPDEESDSGS